jgi:hypothetical protein
MDSEYSEYVYDMLRAWCGGRVFKRCVWGDICVGDDVYACYIPYSQKHFDELTPVWGKVVEKGDSIKLELDGETAYIMEECSSFVVQIYKEEK